MTCPGVNSGHYFFIRFAPAFPLAAYRVSVLLLLSELEVNTFIKILSSCAVYYYWRVPLYSFLLRRSLSAIMSYGAGGISQHMK